MQCRHIKVNFLFGNMHDLQHLHKTESIVEDELMQIDAKCIKITCDCLLKLLPYESSFNLKRVLVPLYTSLQTP